MTKDKKMFPEIRFPEFTDAWEQRKFSDLYVKVTEKNDLSFGSDRIISVANMYFKEDTKESSDDYMKTYNVMRLGDIAFEGNKSKNFAHGRFVENTIGDGIVSHVFDVFRPITEYDLSYWKYFINNEGVMGRTMARCTKSSTMMTNLVANDFLKESVLVPTLAEQKKIGEYFSNLDNLITLHQSKCDQLQILKKSMLQKMFPKKDEKVPEIRFPGFTDDWEQRKCKDVAPLQRGFDLPVSQMIQGSYPVVMSNGIGGYHNECKAKGPGVVTGRSGTIGKLHYVTDDYWPHNTALWVTNFNGNSPKFIYYLYYKLDLSRFGTGSGVPTLNRNDVHDTFVSIPIYDEQVKIAEYLTNLDNLITLHQRKCDQIKALKKSMLQKMFI